MNVREALRRLASVERGSQEELRDDARGHDALPETFGSWNDLRRELDRCRRFGREFALVRVPGRDRGRIARLVRSTDYVWSDRAATYVLLPESNTASAEGLIARLQREAPELLPERGVQVASFPEDGLTSGALLSALSGRPLVLEPAPAATDARTTERRAASAFVNAA
jgi:hypothetical protein